MCIFVQRREPRRRVESREWTWPRQEEASKTQPNDAGRHNASERTDGRQRGEWAASLPATRHELLLHLACGRDGRRRAGDVAGGGVDNGDGVAGALGQRLVELGRLSLVGEARGGEGVGGSGQDEAWRGLELLLERGRFGRAARERRSVRAGRVDGLQIVVGQKMEGTKELVVVEVKGTSSLEVATEGSDAWGLDGLLGSAGSPEVLVVVVGGSRPGSSPRATGGVLVLRVVHVGGGMLGSAVVEVGSRHDVVVDRQGWRRRKAPWK